MRLERHHRARRQQRRYAVLVCGSRDWADRKAIYNRLKVYPPGTLVIHGDCETGADCICDEIARSPMLGLSVWPVPYLYEHGRAGGPRRNALMLEVLLALQRGSYCAVVEAFDLGGPGTADMLRRARAATGVKVIVTTPPEMPTVAPDIPTPTESDAQDERLLESLRDPRLREHAEAAQALVRFKRS